MKSEMAVFGALVVLGLVVLYKTTGAVKEAANAINPVNNDNIINRGTNALMGLDNKTASLGTKIYDWFHPEQEKLEQPGKVTLPKKGA